jgi:hypothetical protein
MFPCSAEKVRCSGQNRETSRELMKPLIFLRRFSRFGPEKRDFSLFLLP